MLCHVLAFHACYFASVIHVKLKNKKIMATINLSNDFMAKMLEDNAWKELSGELQWTEQMLEKYKEKVDWKEVTTNRNIVWTVPMIEKFKNRIDLDELSSSDNDHLFTAEQLDRYKHLWNWHELSRNSSLQLTEELLERFADRWDWSEIIDCYGRDGMYSAAFYEKYQERIPASALHRSSLWNKLVEDEKKQLKVQIYS